MFRDVPECSGVFRNVPFSEFYRRPNEIASRFFKLQYGLVGRHFSSVSGEYRKKIPEKSFDIFGIIKTIGWKNAYTLMINPNEKCFLELYHTSRRYIVSSYVQSCTISSVLKHRCYCLDALS